MNKIVKVGEGGKMNDKLKDMALLIFVVLTIICFILALDNNLKANKYRKSFEKEMAFRMDMEENVNKLRSEKMDLTSVLKDKELEIQKKAEAIETLNKDISEREAKITETQEKLDKLKLLKDKLEDNLQDELANPKPKQ